MKTIEPGPVLLVVPGGVAWECDKSATVGAVGLAGCTGGNSKALHREARSVRRRSGPLRVRTSWAWRRIHLIAPTVKAPTTLATTGSMSASATSSGALLCARSNPLHEELPR
jgi:hypothetical protein